ncbi:pyruvate dehydrogenase complex dihydrolipoamide acetyltransferase [Bradyrhizobium prioriisuperbiae]|uniref:pyruvate dehydrogenase complex dihydrolipoamide acetyltransferase n=1 Tax=Bradyrhizobium prioriisuperbiae TaxID=2854389 RepID=UPI0028ECE122|nr:pyruvate dehydrogenase complex dihydrolipoamide acetyltransferase [Bradyrhizobium prioritasuperba]
MPINILMPALSPTMEKGNLAKWLKKEGDKVKSGDVIAEIETDKATMEVEAVDEGTIAKILVPEGTADVPVNDVIAVLASEGEDVKSAASASAAPALAKAEAPKAESPKAEAPKAAPAEAPKPAPAPAPQAAAASAPGQRVFSSPLARRLAKESGLDLSRVTGSGPHGRVVARDVESAKSGQGLKPAAAAAPAAAGVSAPPPAGPTDQQIRALFAEGSYEVVPHDNMRKVIAQRLTAAKRDIPHYYLTTDCDIGKLLAAREEINAAAPKDKDGKPAYKISVNDFVIKALAVALQRVPDANVTFTESAMLKHKVSDISVAVSIPSGLITPVIRNAHLKPVSVISAEMKDFAARARARKLKPEEYQGGTTAVSNLGMYGIKDFTAVINPPQSSILAVGAGEERAVVRNGKIEIANIMSVTLSCDHRAMDGALGAQLVSAFRGLIENPIMMVV